MRSLLLVSCLLVVGLCLVHSVGATSAEGRGFLRVTAAGTNCNANGRAGVCQSGTCAGTYYTGFCPGAASIRCCVPTGTAASSSSGGSLTVAPYRYKFPYSQNRHIVADIAKQRIRLYDGSKSIREWKISSGKNGVSFSSGSLASPVGRFKVIGKYGAGAPLGMRFESLRAIGQIGKPTDSMAYVQTRILQISGQDPENGNTATRGIYIHGTNAEMQLGWQGSHGCFRMGNKDVVELFDLVPVGVEFYAMPRNAWP